MTSDSSSASKAATRRMSIRLLSLNCSRSTSCLCECSSNCSRRSFRTSNWKWNQWCNEDRKCANESYYFNLHTMSCPQVENWWECFITGLHEYLFVLTIGGLLREVSSIDAITMQKGTICNIKHVCIAERKAKITESSQFSNNSKQTSGKCWLDIWENKRYNFLTELDTNNFAFYYWKNIINII